MELSTFLVTAFFSAGAKAALRPREYIIFAETSGEALSSFQEEEPEAAVECHSIVVEPA